MKKQNQIHLLKSTFVSLGLIFGAQLSIARITSEIQADITHPFIVGSTNHVPQHSELIFNRYGQKEFLSKIFQQGSRVGSAVAEVPRQEQPPQKQGQHPVEDTEPRP